MTDSTPAATDEGPGAFRHGWLFGAVWLVYLSSPLSASLDERGAQRVVGVTAVGLFAVVYLYRMARGRQIRREGRQGHPWPWITVLLVLEVVMTAGAGDRALAAGVFVAAFAMFALPVRRAWVFVVTLGVVSELAVVVVPGWTENGDSLAVLLAATAVFAIRVAFDRNQRLVATRQEMTELAVSEERSRFARDLHDILGHSLTVVAIKAELAGRLLETDPARAAAEIADVERLAREALADVRGAVSGYREVTLVRELVTARAALAVAGVESDLPGAVDEVPGELRELFGWVVREGVTNVVRHSGAHRCSVRVTATSVEVADDGRGCSARGSGNGLDGLRERAAAAGCTLTHASTDHGFTLTVALARDRVPA